MICSHPLPLAYKPPAYQRNSPFENQKREIQKRFIFPATTCLPVIAQPRKARPFFLTLYAVYLIHVAHLRLNYTHTSPPLFSFSSKTVATASDLIFQRKPQQPQDVKQMVSLTAHAV
jgi:hypothetical protein